MAMASSASTFISNTIQTLLSVAKILIQSRYFPKKLPKTTSSKCIVLGNGPSLTKEIENSKSTFVSTPKLAVNLFVKSDYFNQLKPEYYIINAPEHWFENVNEEGRKATHELYELLNTRTQWDMILMMPYQAKKRTEWKEMISGNPYIHVHYYNKTPVEGFGWFSNLIFKIQLGMPRPHNVVIPALIHAINLGFKEIYLAGVDHSWLSSIRVEQDNTVTMEHVHVYGGAKRYPIFAYIDEKRHLHDMLMKFVHTFRSYFYIKFYAETRKATIYNITEGSFIDAFEKRRLP